MIDMKLAHQMAKSSMRWTIGTQYKEALRLAMMQLWGLWKKARTTPEEAIEALPVQVLECAIYDGYRADGYSTTEAGYLARDVAGFAKQNRWTSIAVRMLKLAGYGTALTEG